MSPACRYVVVDGHSVLFAQPRLAALHAAQSRAARAMLLRILQGFQDHSGLRVCVAFDGRAGLKEEAHAPHAVEVRYADSHQTADALIERAVATFPRPEEVIVVTADLGERHTIESLGAQTLSPQGLFAWIRHTCPSDPLDELPQCPHR